MNVENSPAMAVVLAAGKGTRMEMDIPKVLVPACGRPLIRYVLDTLRQAGVPKIVVVIGYQADRVREELRGQDDVVFVEQTEQLGTGHAVQVCRRELEGHRGAVLILTGDSPLTQADSLRKLLELYQSERPACVLGTLIKDHPAGLGRIVRDANGEFMAIVEEKDASDEQRRIGEVNMSTYVFDCHELLGVLGQLSNDNRQGEYYITDCPGLLKQQGKVVKALAVLKPCEALSINNLADLAAVEAEMRKCQ